MAKYSPVFCVDVTDDFAIGNATTITNPGQAFQIIDVVASGTTAAVVTVRKNTGAGATAAVAIVSVQAAPASTNGSTCTTTDANVAFTSSDNIHITVTVAAVTRVTLVCRAVDSLAPTWTNTTPA
jgi:hypothetical protein